MKSRKYLFIGVSICLILLLSIGVSYSMWKTNLVGSQSVITTIDCFDVTIVSESNAISLTNASAISDEDGKALTPYSFTITNTCNTNASYSVDLELLNGTTLSSDYVKAYLKGNDKETLSILSKLASSDKMENTDSVASYILTTDVLGAKEKVTYNLNLWISNDLDGEQDTDDINGTELSAKIYIKSSPTTNKSTITQSDIDNTLRSAILANNTSKGEVSSVITTTPTDDNSGLYTAEDDYGTSYIFRGTKNATNNHVIFAGFCWQVIRINGDGSIRIMYNGTPTDGTCTTDSADGSIGTSAFNVNYNDAKYVGYMFGGSSETAASESYEAAVTNTYNSTIKTVIDTWYENNLKGTTYESYLADSGFCNDRGISSGIGYGDGTSGDDTEYKALERNYSSSPTSDLKCYQSKDLFTVSSSVTTNHGGYETGSATITGNGALDYPIGLITADELQMAGLLNDDLSYSDKAWTTNSNFIYWSITPFYSGYGFANVFHEWEYGYLGQDTVNAVMAVRPAISLNGEVMISSGNGGTSNPYVIGKGSTKTDSYTYDFDYAGSEQVFTVTKSGTYKIEAWGASGGDGSSTYLGGYGGYSTGEVTLNKGDVLYINVGGKGSTTTGFSVLSSGGYNGGGDAINTNTACSSYTLGSGGGATSIATKSGLLSTLSSATSSILVVSGGGGGGAWCNDSNHGTGGSGGGINGSDAYNLGTDTGNGYGLGATQSAGGSYHGKSYTGSFGKAYTGTATQPVSGGGGGYYGGGSGGIHSAGGGSGYIGSSSLTNKVMYCYNCTESSDESTKTVSTTNVSSTPTSNYAKIGNGYARITLVS